MAEGSEKKIRSRDRKNDPSRKISVKKGRTEVFSTVCENPPKKKNAPQKGALKRCFSHPDCTVGAGTSPARRRLAFVDWENNLPFAPCSSPICGSCRKNRNGFFGRMLRRLP
ncbi:MAG TPA: hypothetical protein DEV98_00815 [Clostridiales bacterium]|nr:hypothetical protein [Clostridiales bacterium]